MEKILNRFNVVFLFLVVFLCSVVNFITATYGKMDVTQLLYFIRFNDFGGVSTSFSYNVLYNCLLLPVVFTCLVLFLLKKFRKNNEPYLYPIIFLGINILIILIADKFLADTEVVILFWVLLLIYIVMLNRNYSAFNIFIMILFLIFEMSLIYNKNYKWMLDFGEVGETNFYKENYKEVVGKNIKNRNVIIIFAESLDKKYAQIDGIKIKDEDAVKFDDFIEGYVQRWTQGALFSALTGTHIHYLSDFFKYKINFKTKILESYIQVEKSHDANNLGGLYKFYTPKINSLGKIAKNNGYQNIFVQGSDLDFSGTKNFLLNNGFDKNNIFGYEEILKSSYFSEIKYSETMMEAVKDEDVYKIFKDKILEHDKSKPFLGIMFTIDLHATGDKDLEQNVNQVVKNTIYNLNDFIEWFKKQDFYENTTLIVVGDHNRMGKGIETGGKIYNAFFNLPDSLKQNVNKKRTFNQIDIFPTILEIMGVDLEHKQAGVGVSLFSDKKTIAERYSYDEQKNIFSKYDAFYYDLWQNDDFYDNEKVKNDKIYENFIAYAGGRINGDVYTNSEEAIIETIRRGYKYIELDLYATKDEQKRIVAYHSCDDLNRYSSKSIDCSFMKFNDFVNLDSKYTLLYDEKILEYFKKNKFLWFVTDKIDDFDLLSEKFSEIKDRMIVEVFSYEKYVEANIKGFSTAYSVKNKKDFEIVLNKNIKMVTIDLDFVKKDINEIKLLKKNKVKILGYTAKNVEKVKEYMQYVDMFYYDGEENLDELNLNVD